MNVGFALQFLQYPFFVNSRFVRHTSDIQKHPRTVHFAIIQRWQIDLFAIPHKAFVVFHLFLHMHQLFDTHTQKLDAVAIQFLIRQINMPGRRRQCQHIKDACADTEIGISVKPGFHRNIVSDPESHAPDVFCQSVRICFNNPIQIFFIRFVYFYSELVADAVLLQKEKGIAHFTFFLKLLRNIHRLFLTDSLYLAEPLRLFFNDIKCFIPEFVYDPLGKSTSNPFDRTGCQISLHRQRVIRRTALTFLHFELLMIRRMRHHITIQCKILPFVDERKCSDTRIQIFFSLFLRDKFKYGISIFLITINDMLHISFFLFHRLSPVYVDKAPLARMQWALFSRYFIFIPFLSSFLSKWKYRNFSPLTHTASVRCQVPGRWKPSSLPSTDTSGHRTYRCTHFPLYRHH